MGVALCKVLVFSCLALRIFDCQLDVESSPCPRRKLPSSKGKNEGGTALSPWVLVRFLESCLVVNQLNQLILIIN